MSCEVILISNDNLLKVTGLKDIKTDEYQNDAAVTAVLKDMSGNEVDGQDWPTTLNYIAASSGDYDGLLEDTLELNVGAQYKLEITATLSGGVKMFVEKTVTAVTRDN